MVSTNNVTSSSEQDILISESKYSQALPRQSTRGPQYLLHPEQAQRTEQTFEALKFTINLGEDLGIQFPQKTIYIFTDHNVQA